MPAFRASMSTLGSDVRTRAPLNQVLHKFGRKFKVHTNINIDTQTIITFPNISGMYLVLGCIFLFVNSVNIFCSGVLPEDT